MNGHQAEVVRVQKRRAFTLLELLVVLAIIGILTAVALPSLKGLQKSNIMTSASQQLVDDLGLPRQYAIKERTIVHVVFVPPEIEMMLPNAASNDRGAERDRRAWTNLLAGAYTTYAIYAERSVGDQPGQPHYRYLSNWKSLPDGVFIPIWKFVDNKALWNTAPDIERPFSYSDPAVDLQPIRFPSSSGLPQKVPHIAFDASGKLLVYRDINNVRQRVSDDEVIPLARGSVLYQRNAAGLLVEPPDARESPPNNSIENYNRVRIDGLTGRAKVERLEVKL